MSTVDVVKLIAEGLIVLLLLYLAFLKSYFQEKGKNLATKEDVDEITSKVESIRSALQYSLHAKLSWRAEEHDTLVDYYSKYGSWLSGITNLSMVGVSAGSADRLTEIRAELDALERDFDSAESRMELFVENHDILLQKGLIKIETLKFHAHAQETTFAFEQLFLDVRQMKSETPQNQQLQPYKELLDKQRNLYRKFKDEQKEFYEALLPSVVEHRRTISAHMRNLITHYD